MSTETTICVVVTHRFTASPERVFDALLDVEKARRFMFATPNGQMVRAEIDPRVGGAFCFIDRREGEDVEHTGEYLEIERPRRLVFTFAADGSDASRVVIEIVPLEAGCELTLTNTMDPVWVDYLDRTRAGWSSILSALDATLS